MKCENCLILEKELEKCREKLQNQNTIKICQRLITREKVEKYNKDVKLRRKIHDIENFIYNFNSDDNIYSKEILKYLGWEGETYGDFVITCLEYLVCEGILEKIRFKTGRKGHIYQKRKIIGECEFLIKKEDGTTSCSCYKFFKLKKGSSAHLREDGMVVDINNKLLQQVNITEIIEPDEVMLS